MEATLLLADWAEAINGKLYIQGGGWSRYQLASAGNQLSCALAIRLLVGWDEANRKHKLAIRLLTEDGHAVEPVEGKPVVIESELEVGRPPGIREGSDLDAALAINIRGMPMEPGRYRFTIEANGNPLGAGATFDLV